MYFEEKGNKRKNPWCKSGACTNTLWSCVLPSLQFEREENPCAPCQGRSETKLVFKGRRNGRKPLPHYGYFSFFRYLLTLTRSIQGRIMINLFLSRSVFLVYECIHKKKKLYSMECRGDWKLPSTWRILFPLFITFFLWSFRKIFPTYFV